MNQIEFTKMVATGNDFVLADNRDKKIENRIKNLSRFAKEVCARKYSVGADGLLLLESSLKADIAMRIFNPDGSEVTMCGNGSRCIAYYAVKKSIAGSPMTIEAKAGILSAQVSNNLVSVEMTPPKGLKNKFSLSIDGRAIELGFVNTGVPHAIDFVDELKAVDVKDIGRKIRFHKEFAPEGTNANFVKVTDRHNILIRTYERGVEDETLACGTGAVAGAIMASERGYADSPIGVKTWGGEILRVHFKKEKGVYKEVFLEGEVKLIYEGRLGNV